ncbi:hypothetical protein GCM10011519_25300 [Marmoricola endophyticus]|uniref:Alkaline shock response membrane anchor protein AmaP n=1 Tax=Marmoricola endophyticus TaxID=2040280 RepID=A0A917F5J9_9ACTN|nr:hypothetical protein [Marmoricola endophyticus]GGF50271.1 hypothetical protein GCM10011519_25300 [Marmoricola endophyticus]
MSTLPAVPDDTADVARPDEAVPDAEAALSAAKPAVGTGAVPLVAQLVALALICLGAVGVQSALVVWGMVPGPAWTSVGIDAADRVRREDVWVLVAGIVAVVVGLLVLRVALHRRPRRGLPVAATTAVDLRPRDLVRLAENLLAGPGAVTGARAKASRRRLKVDVVSGATPDQRAAVAADVRERLEPLLLAMARRPRLRVKVRDASGSRA